MSSSTHEHARQKLQDLRALFAGLPETLPIANDITISLDDDSISEEGHWYALNSCFEASWGHKHIGFAITERGSKIDSTVSVIEATIPHLSVADIGLLDLWLDMFASEARRAGAHVASSSSRGSYVILDSLYCYAGSFYIIAPV